MEHVLEPLEPIVTAVLAIAKVALIALVVWASIALRRRYRRHKRDEETRRLVCAHLVTIHEAEQRPRVWALEANVRGVAGSARRDARR
jgi:hypothetical protein